MRPFTGISVHHGLAGPYDAVVIGAGFGGLICANLLAKNGLRVLLIEQHTVVGGYCSTFHRQGFTFDAASHFYPLLGNRQTLTGRLLAELGVETKWIEMEPVDQFHLPDGLSFAVPSNFDMYLARLKCDFPAEATQVDDFFALVRKLYLLGMLEFFRGVHTERLDPYRHMTVTDALNERFQSPKLKLLLTADCPHWGSPPCRVSFVFDSMLRLAYFLGNYYPAGGSQRLADELAFRFEQAGGHILMRSDVVRVVVERGRAIAVEVETGPRRERVSLRIHTQHVISNADMRQTVFRMIGAEYFPPAFIDQLASLRPTSPCFLTHIGLEGIPTDVLEHVHGYHWKTWDFDRVGQDAFRFKLFVPTLYEAGMAPPGCHVLIVQKMVEMNYDAVDDWNAHKQAVTAEIMAGLEQLLPGFSRHIVVQLSATARTSFHYTRNQRGAMLGWEMSPDQLGQSRPDVVGPIKNLFFVGQWTRPGGGITPVIVSAMRVARHIIGGELPAEVNGRCTPLVLEED